MVKLFLDGADLGQMKALFSKVDGFTTNPSLMRKAGIANYRSFAKDVLAIAKGKPVSFEVLSDDFTEMENQALQINGWGENIYIKIPITNCAGISSIKTIERLVKRGLKLNITAVMTLPQISAVLPLLITDSILSIFAGRIMDTGESARMQFEVAHRIKPKTCEILWASPRQIYDVVRAKAVHADIITLTPELISKLALLGKSLEKYSLETVQMFHNDAKGIKL